MNVGSVKGCATPPAFALSTTISSQYGDIMVRFSQYGEQYCKHMWQYHGKNAKAGDVCMVIIRS